MSSALLETVLPDLGFTIHENQTIDLRLEADLRVISWSRADDHPSPYLDIIHRNIERGSKGGAWKCRMRRAILEKRFENGSKEGGKGGILTLYLPQPPI